MDLLHAGAPALLPTTDTGPNAMPAADILALWHVGLAEALFLVALLVAINGLDDLAIDLLWMAMPARHRAPCDAPPPAPGTAPPHFAIIIPA